MKKIIPRQNYSIFLVFILLSTLGTKFNSWAGTGYTIPNATVNFSNSLTINQNETVADNENLTEVIGIYSNHSLDSFTNTINGTISASGSVGNASAKDVFINFISGVAIVEDGVEVVEVVDEFNNAGTITATASFGNVYSNCSTNLQQIYGVYVSTYSDTNTAQIGSFLNTGSLNVVVNGGKTLGANSGTYLDTLGGVYLETFCDSGNAADTAYLGGFNNSGTITFNLNTQDTEGELDFSNGFGVYLSTFASGNSPAQIGNISNSGTISAVAKLGSAISDTTDDIISIYSSINNFFDAFSVYVYSENNLTQLGSFNNNGTIKLEAQVNDAIGNASHLLSSVYTEISNVYGVDIWLETNNGSIQIGPLENSQNILVNATAGSAIGDATGANSSVYCNLKNIAGISLVAVNNAAGNINQTAPFLNSGTIKVNVSAGDAAGENSKIEITNIQGTELYFFGNAQSESYLNNGTIEVTTTAGNASSTGASISLDKIYGAKLTANNNWNIQQINNSKEINLTVQTGEGSTVSNVSGIYLSKITSSQVENSGKINININTGSNSSVLSAAGITINNSTLTLSNPGTITLSTNNENADIRTLRIVNSNVTLVDKFGISFGDKGISQRPIYLDATSSLNLDNVELVALKGTELRFNDPYYIIENDGGTLSGEFGSLTRGFSNPDIILSWYDSQRGENAAILFNYQPQSSLAAGGIYAATILNNNMLRGLLSNLAYQEIFPIYAQRSPQILLAQINSPYIKRDAKKGFFKTQRKDALFAYPFYTRIEDKGIGLDSDAYGVCLGYEHKVDEELSGGIFTGFQKAEIEYNLASGQDSNEPWIYPLGTYITYRPYPWYLSFAAEIYAADNDYQGLTGLNYEITEKADYWSQGAESEIKLGYILEQDQDAYLIPEIGIGYSFWRVEEFHTHASDPDWNRYFARKSDGYLKLVVGITSVESLKLANKKLDLLLGLRVERALTDNDISSSQSIPALGTGTILTKKKVSDTTLVCTLGTHYQFSDNWHLNLGLRSDFNSDYRAYTGKATLGKEF